MALVLNELSYSPEWIEGQAKPLYDTFFGVCLELQKGFKQKISFKYTKVKDSEKVVFRDSVSFLQWLSEQSKENKSSVLSLLTGGQFILDYPYYKIFGEEGKGIGYAYENGILLLSFQSDAKWKACFLDITQELLNEKTAEIDSETLKISNCHDLASLECHTDFIQRLIKEYSDSTLTKIKNEILRGGVLWEKRVTLFPSLEFCGSTQEYISNIQAGDVLYNLLGRLYEYELYFAAWKEGDFEPSKVKGNPRLESDTRLKEHNGELLVICPDGANRLFTYHCNYGVYGFRLHFFPNTNSRKCIIGYIGKKLV